MIRRLMRMQETYVFLAIVVLALIVGFINPTFFSFAQLFNILNSTIVTGLFALSLLVVLISGGIDVSFVAVGTFAFYTTVKLLVTNQFDGPFIVPLVMAIAFGTLLGLVNGFFIARFRLMTLIVTLGTLSAFTGITLAFVGTTVYSRLPASMVAFSRWHIAEVAQGRIRFGLHGAILVLLACALITWFILNRTMVGRGIFALGGDPVAAQRAGFNVAGLQYFIYGFAGAMAGVAGLMHTSMARFARAVDLQGMELMIFAAVILGGARVTGGKGTVVGTLLGTFLVAMIENSLVLVGIPSFWKQAVIGFLIIVGTIVPSLLASRQQTPSGTIA